MYKGKFSGDFHIIINIIDIGQFDWILVSFQLVTTRDVSIQYKASQASIQALMQSDVRLIGPGTVNVWYQPIIHSHVPHEQW